MEATADTAAFGVLVAFTAGFLSFLSPCVLPLIPSYVTFITGMSVDEVQRSRRLVLVHSLLFIAGFTLIFLALGASASVLGRTLLASREWISRVGGALVIVFGLYLLGVFNFAFLARERRVHIADKPAGYLGTVLVGIAFGAGWTPCIGPILGTILTYTASTADLPRGLLLLFTYSLGLAIPFLAASLAIDRFLAAFARFRTYLVWTNRVGGVLLIGIGLLLLTDTFSILASQLQAWTPEAIRKRI
jgi:cytochrome c-type biogenesis protein